MDPKVIEIHHILDSLADLADPEHILPAADPEALRPSLTGAVLALIRQVLPGVRFRFLQCDLDAADVASVDGLLPLLLCRAGTLAYDVIPESVAGVRIEPCPTALLGLRAVPESPSMSLLLPVIMDVLLTARDLASAKAAAGSDAPPTVLDLDVLLPPETTVPDAAGGASSAP
ncbi:MAG: hypothetical protein LBR22_01965 [Desulfovibrio sp.]|jgi:hypothetical protein|nr:hypothetical protein [Desulfovibrio sp.]